MEVKEEKVYTKKEMLDYCEIAFIAGFANGSLSLEDMLIIKSEWMIENIK